MTNKPNQTRGKKTPAGKPRKPVHGRPSETSGDNRTTRTRFPEVQGKVLETVELALEDEENYISIGFADKTSLHFDLEPEPGFTVIADYCDWKTHNRRRIKKWPAFRSA